MNINGHEVRIMGIVERDATEGRSSLERNSRPNDTSENKQQQTNGNDAISTSANRQQEPGLIRYVYEGNESTIPYLPTNLSNTSALYCGDKVRI